LSSYRQSAANVRASERRLHPRRRVFFSCVELAEDNGGVVLDVCECGLAMRAVRALGDDQFTQLRFQLSQSNDWIETRGRIAWISDSRTTAGVEFIDLSCEGRILLGEWISSIQDLCATAKKNALAEDVSKADPQFGNDQVPTTTRSVPEPKKTEEALNRPSQNSSTSEASFSTRSIDSEIGYGQERLDEGESQPRSSIAVSPRIVEASRETFSFKAKHDTHRDGKSRILIALLATFVLISAGLYGLSRYRRSEGATSQKAKHPSADLPGLSAAKPQPAVTLPPAKKPPSPAEAPEITAGFVLQAGAMTHRGNAVALASSLQQKHFPAFVFKGDSAPFYHVIVGPYPDTEATAKISKELRDQGFDTFVRKWPFR
jgi:septal ring-binding cell division protein DamX